MIPLLSQWNLTGTDSKRMFYRVIQMTEGCQSGEHHFQALCRVLGRVLE